MPAPDQRPDHVGTALDYLTSFDSASLPPAHHIAAAQAHALLAIASSLRTMAAELEWPVAP